MQFKVYTFWIHGVYLHKYDAQVENKSTLA